MRLIKEFLFYSIGFASLTTEKLTKVVQSLIEQNKITAKEGVNFVEEYSNKIAELTKKFDAKLEDFVNETLQNCSFANIDEVKEIEERIKKVEEKLSQSQA